MHHKPSGVHFVRLTPREQTGDGHPSALPAIGLPEAGQPVRRYPRCYLSPDVNAAGVPSLPYLADALFNKKAGIADLCPPIEAQGALEKYAPKRIHYTLPALSSHQDATGEGNAFRLWSIYRNVYNRCTVDGLFSDDSECSRDEMVAEKVVVIGASSQVRRDRHFTPLGDMAGAEVVINAIRSFALYPQENSKSLGQALLKKSWIVLACMFVWLAFFCLKELLKPPPAATVGARAIRGALVGSAFAAALMAVLLITFKFSYSSLSVLIGVLAIGVEQYVEFVTNWVIHPFERGLKRVLGLSMEHE